jgi:hypothetical protein
MNGKGKVGYRYGEKPEEVERMDYLEFIARVTSHIPDKGQVTVRYYGLYGNAHRGRCARHRPDKHLHPSFVRRRTRESPGRGWAEIRRKVFEVDPLTCPSCGSRMRIIAFITDYAVVDSIINHLNLTFVAERPPPPHVASQQFFLDSEAPADYFS